MGGFLDDGSKDLEGDLDIAVEMLASTASRAESESYPSFFRPTSLTVFFSR